MVTTTTALGSFTVPVSSGVVSLVVRSFIATVGAVTSIITVPVLVTVLPAASVALTDVG